MRSTQLLIHELELDIQGVSVDWVHVHQELIATKIIQIFNTFENFEDSSLAINYVEIDIGKCTNFEEFLFFLDIELARWNRNLQIQKGQHTNRTETNSYFEIIENDWNTVFNETKDFFNADITSDSNKLKIKFLEISAILQRNPEQFWRWLQGLGINKEWISRFRKFLYNQQLPNEAIVAWTTSMLIIKDKKPAESYEKILTQILIKNFSNSYKLALLIKRNDDEFIQFLNSTENEFTLSSNNKFSEFIEFDWQILEKLILWDEILPDYSKTINMINQIPIPYLIKILQSKNWEENNKFWESFSVFLINNNFIKKSDLNSSISYNINEELFHNIQLWLYSTSLSNQTAKELTQLIILLATSKQSIQNKTTQLQQLIKKISPKLTEFEYECLFSFWDQLFDSFNINQIPIRTLTSKIQQIFTLALHITQYQNNYPLNIFDYLIEISNLNNNPTERKTSKDTIKYNTFNNNIDTDIFNNDIINNNKKLEILQFIQHYYNSLELIFNNNPFILKILMEFKKLANSNKITSNNELLKLIHKHIKIQDKNILNKSIQIINNKIHNNQFEKQELIYWFDWLYWLFKSDNINKNITYDVWKSDLINKLSTVQLDVSSVNSDILETIKNELTSNKSNTKESLSLLSKEEISWFESFFQEFQSEKNRSNSFIPSELLDFYFSIFNYIVINELKIKQFQFQFTNNNRLIILTGEKQTLSYLHSINKKLISSDTSDFVFYINLLIDTKNHHINKDILNTIINYNKKLTLIESDLTIKTTKSIKESIKQLLINEEIKQSHLSFNVETAPFILSIIQIFQLWQTNIEEFNKSKIRNSEQVLELSAPKIAEVINNWMDENNNIQSEKIYLTLDKSIKYFLIQLQKIEFIIRDINSTYNFNSKTDILEIYNIKISELITNNLTEININNEIGATAKLNFLIQSSLESVGTIINEIIRNLLNINPKLSRYIYAEVENKGSFDIKTLTYIEFKLIKLIEINFTFQNQVSETINLINDKLKIALTNPLTETSNLPILSSYNRKIYEDNYQINSKSHFITWTNNLETIYGIDEIITNVDLFLNLIKSSGSIPIITTSGTNSVVQNQISNIELIKLLFNHPRWRELFVQLTRSSGHGFNQIASHLTLKDSIDLINNKFPKSTSYNSDVELIINNIILGKGYQNDFIQKFKFFWIQQTSPPNLIRILQIIIESYLTTNQKSILQFIQDIIVPSQLFKRLNKFEKKTFDEWINYQLKTYHQTYGQLDKSTVDLITKFANTDERIPLNLLLYSDRSLKGDITPNDNKNTLTNLKDLSYVSNDKSEIDDKSKESKKDDLDANIVSNKGKLDNEENYEKNKSDNNIDHLDYNTFSIKDNIIVNNKEENNNFSNPSHQANLQTGVIDNQLEIESLYKITFEKYEVEWTHLIQEIKDIIIKNHTISEAAIGEQIYIVTKKRIPSKIESFHLQKIIKSMICLSLWFEILEELPDGVYNRLINFNSIQQNSIIGVIKKSKNSLSNELKVNFLVNLVSDYLYYKTTHWVFQEAFDSISTALVKIKLKKPTIYKSILSQIKSSNKILDRQWDLPLIDIYEPKHVIELSNTKAPTEEFNRDLNTPIYFPIIETNWSVWQKNQVGQNPISRETTSKIIQYFLTNRSKNGFSTFSWLDSLLSLGYLQDTSLYSEFLLNKILISDWFLQGNNYSESTEYTRNEITIILDNFLKNVANRSNPTIESSVGFKYYSGLNEVFKNISDTQKQQINSYFKEINNYFLNIINEIITSTPEITLPQFLSENDKLEIYNFNVLKLLLNSKYREVDWLKNRQQYNNSGNENISTLFSEINKKLTTDNAEIITTTISYIQKFQQILNELIEYKPDSPKPIYWEISVRLIINALIDSSKEFIESNYSDEIKTQIIQFLTSPIEDLFDKELLKESIKENLQLTKNKIESNFDQTSNNEASLILYWLSENFNIHLENFSIEDDPILNNLNAKSNQIPETEHITDLILQPLMMLNYESGLTTNDYFKETLIPILLLSATQNESKQIKNILDSYLLRNTTATKINADLAISDNNLKFDSEIQITDVESNIIYVNESNVEQEINNIREVDLIENKSLSEDDKTNFPGNEIIVDELKNNKTLDNNSEKIVLIEDGNENTKDSIITNQNFELQDVTDNSAIADTNKLNQIDQTNSNINSDLNSLNVKNTTNEVNSSELSTSENSESGQRDTNKTPLIQLPYSIDSIIQQLFNGQPDHTGQLQNALEDILKTIPNSEIDKIVSKIKEIWEKQIKPLHIIEGHIQKPDLFKAIEGIPSVKKIEIKKTEEIKQDNTAIKKAVNQGTRFATGLCGMIMLAPYYGTLFRRMNLIENNNFKSELEQLKAYSIIFHIAKLHEETPSDYQDLVPRIIVGIPPEASISGILQLTADELEEIEKFLTAVKSQWKLMNNVTLRGFIQSFLLRTGKVWKEGDKWKIEVDTHGADIILKTVPWGFSFIKYPWNPYIIETKWELD